MELEGKIWKSKKHWLVEVPSLDVMTQGKTRAEALFMLEDAVMELIYSYFPQASKNLAISVNDYKKGVVGIASTDSNLLLSFVLKRQREKSQSSVREASHRLGSTSPHAYAQYEKGKINISLDKFERLLHAANPYHPSLLRIV